MHVIESAACGRIREAFEKNFSTGEELGAEVCVWQDNREILRLGGGWRDAAKTEAWTGDTLVLVWSATKGPASACALLALQEAGIGVNTPVSAVWNEFAANGKSRVTFSDVFAHRGGLAIMREEGLSIFDNEAVADSLAAQEPYWTPGSCHGYPPRTFGYLLEAIVKRVTGKTLKEYWIEKFAIPLELEFWIGLPEGLEGRMARMHAARVQDLKPPRAFEEALANRSSLTAQSFARPSGMASPSATNSPQFWHSSNPSFGGIGNARALAKFYAHLAAGGTFHGEWKDALTHRASNGFDEILRQDSAFSAGFMMDPVDASGKKVRDIFGPYLQAFGHPGAGGSLAFADPENRIGFAYVMNRMENGVMREMRPLRLVRALYGTS